MTRAEIRSQIESNIGRTDKSSNINTAINLGIRHIAVVHTFPQMKTSTTQALVQGDYSFALPSGMKELYQVRLLGDTRYIMTFLPPDEFDLRYPDLAEEEEGYPSQYMVWGETVNFAPPASSSYNLEIRYSKWPDELSLDATSQPFTGLDELVIAAGTLKTFESLQAYDKESPDVQAWNGIFNRLLFDAIRADRTPAWKPVMQGFRIPGIPWVPTSYANPFIRGYR